MSWRFWRSSRYDRALSGKQTDGQRLLFRSAMLHIFAKYDYTAQFLCLNKSGRKRPKENKIKSDPKTRCCALSSSACSALAVENFFLLPMPRPLIKNSCKSDWPQARFHVPYAHGIGRSSLLKSNNSFPDRNNFKNGGQLLNQESARKRGIWPAITAE